MTVYGLDAERIVGSHSGTSAVPTSLVDTRLNVKLSRFPGRDEDWCLRFGTSQMDAAAVHSTITVAAWTISKCLWHLFTMWCDGKALGIVKLSNKIGLEARRQLKLEPDAR